MKLLVLIALLFAGCATGVRAVTPYTSDQIEDARAQCLDAGAVWVESQAQARCLLPSPGEKT